MPNVTPESLFERMVCYAQGVTDGNIVACKAQKWSCKRFLKDLERQNTESFPYYLDIQEIYRFYNWALLFKHTKGVLRGKPIELADILLFDCGNMLGWKNKSDGYRRFRKAYISKARKNVKTQVMALVASYIAFTDPFCDMNEVYIAGWDKEQSSICYNEILKQLEKCDFIKGKYETSYNRITHKKTGSIIRALSREAKNTGDGFNPSVGIIDEYHAHKTSEIYDVIYDGMIARPDPLMIIITTAGFNLKGPCYDEYKYALKILDPDKPEYDNEEYYISICELDEGDDWKDEAVWAKANPIVVTYPVGLQNLRGKAKTAQQNKSKLRDVLTKNFNIWVQMAIKSYMDMGKWRECLDESLTLETCRGMSCYVGVDFSSKLDLTGVGFVIRLPDGRFAVFAHGFIPLDAYEARLQEHKLPWDVWKDEDFITVIDEPVIDQGVVEQYIIDTLEEYELTIIELCYDPWRAEQFALNFSKNHGIVTVEIRQGYKTMSEPLNNFRENVLKKFIVHPYNPVLDFCVGNAVEKMDDNSNIKLDKERSEDKIDLIVAIINAYVRAYIADSHVSADDALNEYLRIMAARKKKG